MRRMKAFVFTSVLLALSILTGTATAQKVVKIAFLGPLTGSVANFGIGARNSFDLAIREANKSGQLKFKLEGVALDDEANPATGVAAATKVVSDSDIVAAVGHFNSPVALATIHVFHRAGVPIVLWGTTDPSITKKYNYPEVTRVLPTMDVQSLVASEFAFNKGYKVWAIIHDSSDYGKKAKEDFSTAIEALGAKVISIDSVQPGEKDFMPILTKIKQLQPQAIFAGVVIPDGALIRLQMKKLGMENVFYIGPSGITDVKFNEIAGDAAEGTVSIHPGVFLEKIPKGRKFLESYKEAGYKEPVSAAGDVAYDSANIVIEALKKVGPNKKELAKAIRNISYDGVRGMISFDEFGQTKLRAVTVMVSQSGKWIPWEDSDYAKGLKKLPGQR